jgi:hypothetical protein
MHENGADPRTPNLRSLSLGSSPSLYPCTREDGHDRSGVSPVLRGSFGGAVLSAAAISRTIEFPPGHEKHVNPVLGSTLRPCRATPGDEGSRVGEVSQAPMR